MPITGVNRGIDFYRQEQTFFADALTSCKNDISPLNSHREPKWKFQHHA